MVRRHVTLPSLHDRGPHGRPGHPVAVGLGVFAAEPDALQLAWTRLGPGPVHIRIGDASVDIATNGGPGAVTITGLPAAHQFCIVLTGEGVPTGRRTLGGSTTLAPPGAELGRIATVSDAHIGETTFGYLQTISEINATPLLASHSMRCLRAAADEALGWGAERLVVKGDLVDQSHPGNWRAARAMLESLPVPVDVVPGNHETKRRRSIEAVDALAGSSIALTESVATVPFGDAALVLVNTARPGEERGHLASSSDALIDALHEVQGGALVAMHHHLRRNHRPSGWPVGVPVNETLPTLDRIAATHPATLLTSGHVHRNRRAHYGPLTLTSVGSVKDYPGVWAGYVFYEGGIRQVVRRVEEPSSIQWTERTGDALGGFYRHWTPARLASRSFSLMWERGAAAGAAAAAGARASR